MKVSAVMLGVALAAMVGGAWLIAVWAVGLVILVWGGLLAAWAVLRDDGSSSAVAAPAQDTPLERFRRSA